jgi:hypothetical protein
MKTYVARVEHRGILPPDFRKGVALVAEQAVHVPDEAEVLLVPAGVAYCAPPLLNRLEYLHLHARGAYGRPLGKPADELVEELLGADLQVERIAAVLDADVEQVEGEQGHVRVAVVDIAHNGHGGLARRRALLGIDEVGDLEVEGQVRLVVLGGTGARDEALELRGGGIPELPPAVAGRVAG